MFLKRLQLQGYKTFAERADFVFDKGITAIVGPNGSGKSNIADAVRWVLGEQSFSLLRARRSEDMIFSGSERRGRMGMAEVTMTLDNSEQWLPVEFGEVTLTRRSYRSGENQYLLNGSRVRLRDISDLLGKSGLSRRTYTVIGQGLIDAALSLRPQERRGLIEEAAGLTLYQSRRTDTLAKLEETKRNVLRVHDLIAEISPRLPRLQHQAERAHDYERVRGELDQALRVWYSYQWKYGREELRRVRAILEHQCERLDAHRALVQELSDQIAETRSRQAELRHRLGEWHRESSALHTRSETRQRELAVAEERRRLLVQLRDQTVSEIARLQVRRADQADQSTETESDLADLLEMRAHQQSLVEGVQSDLERRQVEVAELQESRAQMQASLVTLHGQIADHENRLQQLAERRQELRDGLQAYRGSLELLSKRQQKLQDRALHLDTEMETVQAAARKVEDQREQREQRVVTLQTRQQDLAERRNELDQRLGRLRERHDLLTRMRDEGAGLFEGVRNVLQARAPGSGNGLTGILGTVAELVDVPQDLETAIEVALGSQLQDVVVESWSAAQSAIAYLKRTRGGRATFLPIDTLRAGQPLRVTRGAGVVGVASELIECKPGMHRVVQYLLGRTIVCQDLTHARRVLGEVKGGYQIVTLEGELVRSSGAVTGGTSNRQRGGGILAREREWRELPDQIAALEVRRHELERSIDGVAVDVRAVRAEIQVLAAQGAKLDEGRREREREHLQVQQQVEQIEREQLWYRSLTSDSERDLDELGQRTNDLQQRLDDLLARVGDRESELARLAAQLEQMDDQDLNARLAERRADLTFTMQRQARIEAELRAHRESIRQVDEQIETQDRRLEGVKGDLAQTEDQIEALGSQQSALGAEIQAYTDRIEPAERELVELEEKQDQLEQQESPERSRLQASETRHSHAELQVSRQQDHMNSLRRQIEDDLGLVDLEMGEDVSGQALLPMGALVESLPEVEALPEGMGEQIRALKRRLRRLEPVNLNAPDEYREARERHEFLSTQAHDLKRATAHLREVIAELDAVMQREFRRTFNAVAREFRAYFAELFDGGSARLQLTQPDDLMDTGIDVIVRPPGKRQQSLAVLSGGERALSATALIFAILKVSPTPFCILDEVDAALDEANAGRFRLVLKALSERTQFVVITHNRYTIEAADIVYGISMGVDGTSCVISHRMGQREG